MSTIGAVVSASIAAAIAYRVALVNRAAAVEQGEMAARRAYEFDARKRLYEAAEPLLFQLTERARDTLSAIHSLAEEARSGNLAQWVAHDADDYYPQSIAYALLLPAVLFTLLRRNLTAVDLRLSPHLTRSYRAAKTLYETWMLDYELAAYTPELKYVPDPSTEHDAAVRAGDPAADRQGIVLGYLERAVDVMIAIDGTGQRYCRSFSDFEQSCADEHSPLRDVEGLVREFHPKRHKVLWRVLIMQAILCSALVESGVSGRPDDAPQLKRLCSEAREALSWSTDADERDSALAEIGVVEDFLRRRYDELWRPLTDDAARLAT